MAKWDFVKLSFLVGLLVGQLFVGGQGFAEALSSDNDLKLRKALAQDFIKKVPPQWLVKELVEEAVRKAPKHERQAMKGRMLSRVDMAVVQKIHLKYLVKYFSADELRAMIRFYGSEAGFALYKKSHKFASRSARETFPLILFAYKDELKAKAQTEKEMHDF